MLFREKKQEVRWSSWSNPSVVEHGKMPVAKVGQCMVRYRNAAKKVMQATGSDHVVYGMKMFGKHGKLSAVHFYMWPMKEQEFKRVMGKVHNAEVYAVHRN